MISGGSVWSVAGGSDVEQGRAARQRGVELFEGGEVGCCVEIDGTRGREAGTSAIVFWWAALVSGAGGIWSPHETLLSMKRATWPLFIA